MKIFYSCFLLFCVDCGTNKAASSSEVKSFSIAGELYQECKVSDNTSFSYQILTVEGELRTKYSKFKDVYCEPEKLLTTLTTFFKLDTTLQNDTISHVIKLKLSRLVFKISSDEEVITYNKIGLLGADKWEKNKEVDFTQNPQAMAFFWPQKPEGTIKTSVNSDNWLFLEDIDGVITGSHVKDRGFAFYLTGVREYQQLDKNSSY